MKKNDILISIDKSMKIQIDSDIWYYPDYYIGHGATMEVYYGKNNKTQNDLAGKIEKKSDGDIPYVFFEDFITNKIKNMKGLAQNYGIFQIKDKTVFIESLLGPNLYRLFQFCDYRFTIRTICLIFLDLLNHLKLIHENGFIHNDLKITNLAWGEFNNGCLTKKETIFLIDFRKILEKNTLMKFMGLHILLISKF